MGKNKFRCLTARYACLHASYWFFYCCLYGFAAVFLEAEGFLPSEVGIVLALSAILSGLLSPVVASFLDRAKKIRLQTILAFLAAVCAVSLFALYGLDGHKRMIAVLFFLAASVAELLQSLVSSLSVYYVERGIPVNFGVGRGFGSVGYAVASVFLGWLIVREGENAMLLTASSACIIFLLLAISFPTAQNPVVQKPDAVPQEPCSLLQFFRRYRTYCLSLVGFFFLLCYHLMTENYMIHTIHRLGGDESDLGFSLMLSTILEVPLALLFSRLSSKAGTATWLRISAASFLLRSIGYLLAPSVRLFQAVQVFQLTAFGLYAPASVLYAREQVAPEDMVKGQGVLAAAFAFGNCLGNFLGGQIIERWGTVAMLRTGAAFAVIGTVIVFLTVKNRSPETVTAGI